MQSIKQRDDLSNLTTGKLKEAIDSATDDVIQKAYIDRRYEISLTI